MALDLKAATTPPPAKSKPSTASRAKVSAAKTNEREEGLVGLVQLASAGCIMGRQLADAQAVAIHGPKIAHETAKLAESNPAIGGAIDKLNAVGPYGAILSAALPLVLQILVNHNRVPASPALSSMGVQSPDVLSAQAQADLARQQAAIMAAQREAEEELDKLRDEMNRVPVGATA